MDNKQIKNLNDVLFQQLNRLNVTTLTEKELEVEINRAKAISFVSCQILSSANLEFKQKVFNESMASQKLLDFKNDETK